MGERTWIYHKTEAPKIIDSDDMESYHDEGWRESPAPFIDIKDFGIDADDSVGIQQLGDMVQGVADSLNGALNLDEMSADQLREYALDHYGKHLDERSRAKTLRRQIREMIDGDS